MYSAGNASAVGVDSTAASGVADDVSRETSVGASVGGAVGTGVTGGAVGQSSVADGVVCHVVIVAAAHCKPARNASVVAVQFGPRVPQHASCVRYGGGNVTGQRVASSPRYLRPPLAPCDGAAVHR